MIIDIQNLGINFSVREGDIRAVDKINLSFPKGKITGVIGESGCGKSTLANAILGIFPANCSVDADSKIIFEEMNILGLNREELRKFRWNNASMVFQSAQSSLNPTLPVKDQLLDSIFDHEPATSHVQALERIKKLLGMVNLDHEVILKSYPHQISGGMKQRVIIAMALSLDPELILLDEPTTALDVITQHYIFEIFKNIHKNLNISMILITHDIELAFRFADLIVVMYGGEILEILPAEQVNKKTGHPYTKGLINSVPRISGDKVEIKPIPGHPPDLINKPPGCIFAPRCHIAQKICSQKKPELVFFNDSWAASCLFAKERIA